MTISDDSLTWLEMKLNVTPSFHRVVHKNVVKGHV